MRQRFNDLSIRSKLVLIIAGAVVVLTTAMLALVAARTHAEVRDDVSQELEHSRESFGAIVGNHLRHHAAEIAAEAALPEIGAILRTHDSTAACIYAQRYLDRVRDDGDANDTYDFIALRREDGAPLAVALRGFATCSEPIMHWSLLPDDSKARADRPLVTTWEGPDRRVYQVISAPVPLDPREPGTGSPVTPSLGRNKTGTFSLGFAITDALARHVKQYTGSEAVFWHLEVKGAHVLAASDDRLRPALAAMVNGSRTIPDAVSIRVGGEVVRVIDAPIVDPEDIMQNPEQLHVALAESLTARLQPFRRMELYLALLAGCALVLGTAIGLFLSQPIARPLVALADAARDVERGDYATAERLRSAHPVRLEARDEIGVLARAFVDMVGGLKERLAMSTLMSDAAFRQIRATKDGVAGARAERKSLAVLFTDVRGFSAFSEGRDPGEVIEVVNRVLAIQSEVIRGRGGDIDRFVGDGVVAWFSGDDGCQAAVHAAGEIKARLEDLRGAPGTQVGFGLHAGEVVLGFIGNEARRDFTALGSTVNLAARLCSVAQAGQLLVSSTVAHRLAHRFDVMRIGRLDFKGFSQPIEVWEALLGVPARK
jgi:class 3 adenylate cyclase